MAGVGFAMVNVCGGQTRDVRVHACVAVGGGVSVVRSFAAALKSWVDGPMGFWFVIFSIVGELEAFDRSSALIAYVADNVGDGIGFVAEVAVGGVGN